jgi:hypothetical protein
LQKLLDDHRIEYLSKKLAKLKTARVEVQSDIEEIKLDIVAAEKIAER